MKRFLAGLAVFAMSGSLALAGAKGGPKGAEGVVKPLETDQFVVVFRGGELASVAVSGDGDTDLDLFVYDEFGNLVASDSDDTDDCLAAWVPRVNGRFIIHVVNRGLLSNAYGLITN